MIRSAEIDRGVIEIGRFRKLRLLPRVAVLAGVAQVRVEQPAHDGAIDTPTRAVCDVVEDTR